MSVVYCPFCYSLLHVSCLAGDNVTVGVISGASEFFMSMFLFLPAPGQPAEDAQAVHALARHALGLCTPDC